MLVGVGLCVLLRLHEEATASAPGACMWTCLHSYSCSSCSTDTKLLPGAGGIPFLTVYTNRSDVTVICRARTPSVVKTAWRWWLQMGCAFTSWHGNLQMEQTQSEASSPRFTSGRYQESEPLPGCQPEMSLSAQAGMSSLMLVSTNTAFLLYSWCDRSRHAWAAYVGVRHEMQGLLQLLFMTAYMSSLLQVALVTMHRK